MENNQNVGIDKAAPNCDKTVKVKHILKTCNICHGMGVRERPNGDTFDCPNRSCNNGFIKTN